MVNLNSNIYPYAHTWVVLDEPKVPTLQQMFSLCLLNGEFLRLFTYWPLIIKLIILVLLTNIISLAYFDVHHEKCPQKELILSPGCKVISFCCKGLNLPITLAWT